MRGGSVLPAADVLRRRIPRGGDSLRLNVGCIGGRFHGRIDLPATEFEDLGDWLIEG